MFVSHCMHAGVSVCRTYYTAFKVAFTEQRQADPKEKNVGINIKIHANAF